MFSFCFSLFLLFKQMFSSVLLISDRFLNVLFCVMDTPKVVCRGKSSLVVGPAGDLNYQQLLQLQHLAHKPVIKQPISEYKAPRLLRLMCAKNGHRNSDGKCLCNPEKVVPYIREKLKLPPLPSQEDEGEQKCDDFSEPKSVSTGESFIEESSDSEVSDVDELNFEYSTKIQEKKTANAGEIFKLLLSQSDDESATDLDTNSEANDAAEMHQVEDEDTDVTDIDDMDFYYSNTEGTKMKEKVNCELPKLNLQGSDDDEMSEVLQIHRNGDDPLTDENNNAVVPKLNLEYQDIAHIQFQFDEDGNKVWGYGPDDTDSEVSEETIKRMENQRRPKEVVFVHGVEIPPLNLSLLDDFETPQAAKERKCEDGVAERNAKQNPAVCDDIKSDIKEHKDGLECCGSGKKSKVFSCIANSGQIDFGCNNEVGDESDFESFRSETDSELRKFVNTLDSSYEKLCHFYTRG